MKKLAVTAIYNRLTGDTQLAELMGGSVALYYKRAKRDAPMPYLVHRLRLKGEDPTVCLRGPYLIDVWDYSPDSARAHDIAARVKELLHLDIYSLDPHGSWLQLHWEDDDDIETDNEEVQRVGLEFEAVGYDGQLVAGVKTR